MKKLPRPPRRSHRLAWQGLPHPCCCPQSCGHSLVPTTEDGQGSPRTGWLRSTNGSNDQGPDRTHPFVGRTACVPTCLRASSPGLRGRWFWAPTEWGLEFQGGFGWAVGSVFPAGIAWVWRGHGEGRGRGQKPRDSSALGKPHPVNWAGGPGPKHHMDRGVHLKADAPRCSFGETESAEMQTRSPNLIILRQWPLLC